MNINILIFTITAFLIANAYHDGKYTQLFHLKKKYIQMAMYAFTGFSLYLFIKKSPIKSRGLLVHANNIIKYMPVDKNTKDILGPLFDFSNLNDEMNNLGTIQNNTPQMKRMLNSGGSSTKRSVSETKKKYIAAQQNWKCKHCNSQLDATFEIDHRIELQHGGSNHVTNLEALCRNCHGKKTMVSNLEK